MSVAKRVSEEVGCKLGMDVSVLRLSGISLVHRTAFKGTVMPITFTAFLLCKSLLPKKEIYTTM